MNFSRLLIIDSINVNSIQWIRSMMTHYDESLLLLILCLIIIELSNKLWNRVFPDYGENDYLLERSFNKRCPAVRYEFKIDIYACKNMYLNARLGTIDSDKTCDSGGVTKRVTTVQLFRR